MKITIKDFVLDHLKKEIGTLVDDHPFMAFILMSIGIEFLGRCISYDTIDKIKDEDHVSAKMFKKAIDNLDALAKYRTMDGLYSSLRCGLTHSLMVKNDIQLSNSKNSMDGSDKTLGCRDFYEDFAKACDELFGQKNQKIKVSEDATFAYIHINDGESTTGSTQTIITKTI